MRLIDADKLIDKAYDVSPAYGMTVIGVTEEDIEEAPTVEAIPKADYEARLKADMVAILVELQLDIEEMTPTYHNPDWSITDLVSISEVNKFIQQKINELKGDQEGKMIREPIIAHSELTNEIYIVAGDKKYRVTEQAIKAVKAIKALEQESRWIPVSERLPEPKAKNGLIARYYLIQNEYKDMLVARYDGKGWEQMYQHEYLEDDVIAWMLLPKPYREGREMTRDKAIEELKNYENYPNGLSKECRDYIINVLKQEPILDKIREQIKSHLRGVEITLEVLVENDPLRPKMEGTKDTLEECLKLIDKAESEKK